MLFRSLVPPSEVVTKERNVEVARTGPNTPQNFLDPVPQSGGEVNAPGLNSNEGAVGEIPMFLDQLVGETIKRQPKLKWVDEKFRWTHNAAQK